MDKAGQDPVAQVLGELLRHPEPQRDVELERALLRLLAARSDAAYLLLHRVIVLEAALQQLRSPNAGTAPQAGQRPPSSRAFLRDAAVVAAGVVAGQALWQGLPDTPAADGDEGWDIQGWM